MVFCESTIFSLNLITFFFFQVSVSLAPSWTVAQVKTVVAPKINCSCEDLRIIFAGKELPDDMMVQQCDLGNHSFLHAVRLVAKNKEGQTSSSIASTSSSVVTQVEYTNEVNGILNSGTEQKVSNEC